MTRILHTADLHLQEHGDERWQALLEIISLGQKEKIDLLAISGDLFDQDFDSLTLRDKIREVFTSTGFTVAIIPGNHDSASFSKGLFFGEDTRVLNEPGSPLEIDDTAVWGLPFEDTSESGVINHLNQIADKMSPEKSNILLYHGELIDAFFTRKDMGEEGHRRYMPVRLSSFATAGFHYVLAGHFHTSFQLHNFNQNSYFVYPGSPVSITKREKGQRRAAFIEVNQPPRPYYLDTFHYEEPVIELSPSDNDPLKKVEQHLKSLDLHPSARVHLRVTGYFSGNKAGITEKQLVEELSKIVSKEDIHPHYEFKDIGPLLEDRLLQDFLDKLGQKEADEETKRQAYNLALNALLEAKS